MQRLILVISTCVSQWDRNGRNNDPLVAERWGWENQRSCRVGSWCL